MLNIVNILSGCMSLTVGNSNLSGRARADDAGCFDIMSSMV